MQSTFGPDQIDAHRLLAQVVVGRVTANYENNQKIFSQGEDADFVFFVQEGRVKITVTSASGEQKVLGIAQQGHFFGEACLHNTAVRRATATALGDCRVTSVTKGAILSAIHDGPPRFAKLFVNYLLDHNAWIEEGVLDHLLLSEAHE